MRKIVKRLFVFILIFQSLIYLGGGVSAEGKTLMTLSSPNYVLAKDDDFEFYNGSFRYIGEEVYVEIPNIIQGVNVKSYERMFRDTSVKGVKSTNENITNMRSMFSYSEATELDLSELNTSSVTNMDYMFFHSKATELDVSKFNTSNVTNMKSMFKDSRVSTLDLSSFDTSNITNMESMFEDCQANSLDLSSFDTSSVTDMGYMFYNSQVTKVYARTEADLNRFNSSSNKPSGLTFKIKDADGYILATDDDFTGFSNNLFRYIGNDEYVEIPHEIKGISVTSYVNMFSDKNGAVTSNVKGVKSTNEKVTNMNWMFYGSQATSLNLSSFNTSSVESMRSMFWESKATSLDLSSFDTSNVTNMNSMFWNSQATSLDLTSFDTSNVTKMISMFLDSQATTLALSSFNTNSVTNMNSMFKGTQVATLDLSLFDTSSVMDMSSMFEDSQVTTLDLGSFNTNSVTNMNSMFKGTQVATLDLSLFDTSSVTDMSSMFEDSQVTTLDLSSFNTDSVTKMSSMFKGSKATKGYARKETDANKLNNSSNKPDALNFVVRGISEINFETNGNNNYKQAHSTKVEVDVFEDNLASLQYQWTDSENITTSGTWTDFLNNDNLSIKDKTGDYYLHIKSTGDLGVTTELTSKVFKLDNEKPKLSLSASTVDATNQDVVITATATDNHSGVKQIRMIDGDSKNPVETTFTISRNGMYTFEAEDKAGNTTTETITITNIDKSAPSVPSISGSKEWQMNNQTITITHGTDIGGSGVDKTEYKISEDGMWLTYHGPFDIVQEGQTTVYARTIDKAGNISRIAESTVKIDRTAPQLDLIGDNPLIIEVGTEYVERGATAQDNANGDISEQVDITGAVDISKLGLYEIRYNVTDEAGNSAVEVVREVHVVAPKVILIELDQVAVPVYAGSLVKIKDTDTMIELPTDLPADTMLKVLTVQFKELKDLQQSGEVYDFLFTYQEGLEDNHGEYKLTMGVDETSEQVALYHFQEQWERIGGTLEGNVITAMVSDFSMYGVFVEKEIEKELGDLPITATNQYNWLMIGIVLIVLGSSIWLIHRKKV